MYQEFAQEVKNAIWETLQNVHTAIPGKIVKYDPDKCEAEIAPYGKLKKPNGEYMDFPRLNHVPILFAQSMGQELTIVYAIKPGDECLVLTQEQTLDVWRGSGAESDNDLRFDLTNAIAVVGLFSRPNKLCKRAQNNESIIIQRKDSYIEIYGSTEQINVHAKGDVNIKAASNVIIESANAVNVNAAQNITLNAAQDAEIGAAQNVRIAAEGVLEVKSAKALTIESEKSILIQAPRVNVVEYEDSED